MDTSFTEIKAIIELGRPRNMLISLISVVVGVFMVSNALILDASTILSALSAMFILGGGNALNDFFDYEVDKVNQPKRPIPSGRIKRDKAKRVSMIMFLSGLLLALFVNGYCLMLAVINSVVLTLYARYSKKMFIISNLTVSYLTASVFMYGMLSVYKTPNYNPLGMELLLVLIASSFFMTLSREIIKDIEDVKGDAKAGALTLPIKIGSGKSKEAAVAAGFISILASLTPFIKDMPNFNTTAYAAFIIPSNLIFISSYLKEPKKSQKLIVLGMAISLLAFLAGKIIA